MKDKTKRLILILTIIVVMTIIWYFPYNYQCQKYCNESYANKHNCNAGDISCIHQVIKCEKSNLEINILNICTDEDGFTDYCTTYTCEKRK